MLVPEPWMTTDSTLLAIDQVRNKLEAGEDKVRLIVAARKEFGSEHGNFVLSQAELQIRARQKFTRADQMLLTRVGLEQATSEPIAMVKSNWVPADREVFDVCCGIGGDAIGLARNSRLVAAGHRRLVAADRDPLTCLFARHNLEVYSGESCQVIQRDFEELEFPDNAWVHIDPDRRTKGRTTRPENFSPDFFTMMNKLEMGSPNSQRTLCVKVAPTTSLDFEVPCPVRRQWIGHRRECKQQLLWMGPEESQSLRTATVIASDGTIESFETPDEEVRQVVAPQIDSYLHEPHSAVLAADVVDRFAENFSIGRLSYGSVYLTGDVPIQSSLMATFEVIEQCAMKKKAIAAALKEHQMGTLEWKCRGVESNAVSRLSKIRTDGDQHGVVILTRLGQKYLALICRRVVSGS